MLLWETLGVTTQDPRTAPGNGESVLRRTRRLPFDTRCAALTKAGLRCRGRSRNGTEFCPFHDPELTTERRRRMAAKGVQKRRLSHLPDGYLRKLTNRTAVGHAMDRLYREVRLDVVTPEMGKVLFDVLTRILDSGLVEEGRCPQRTKAARIRPKLNDLLTRKERAAWRRAAANSDWQLGSARDRARRARSGRPASPLPDHEPGTAAHTVRALPVAS